MTGTTRRQLLAATALFSLSGSVTARTVSKALPWSPNEAYPVPMARPGPFLFLSPSEVEAVDAFVARLIPADDLGPGAKEAGVSVFIDRQLAGAYGTNDWLYTQGPFPANPLPSQGMQTPLTPQMQYRQGLAALAQYCQTTYDGRRFAQLTNEQQDALITGLEKATIKLPGFDGRMLFNALYANTMEGFFADPVYGGNRDMAGWKLLGFPGARYDYRDVMDHPNQPYTLPPTGLAGRPAWGQPV